MATANHKLLRPPLFHHQCQHTRHLEPHDIDNFTGHLHRCCMEAHTDITIVSCRLYFTFSTTHARRYTCCLRYYKPRIDSYYFKFFNNFAHLEYKRLNIQ